MQSAKVKNNPKYPSSSKEEFLGQQKDNSSITRAAILVAQ